MSEELKPAEQTLPYELDCFFDHNPHADRVEAFRAGFKAGEDYGRFAASPAPLTEEGGEVERLIAELRGWPSQSWSLGPHAEALLTQAATALEGLVAKLGDVDAARVSLFNKFTAAELRAIAAEARATAAEAALASLSTPSRGEVPEGWREAVARIISPGPHWDCKPTTRFKGTSNKGNWDQPYVWDTEHSSICNPDGPNAQTYPWRRMESPEASQAAADALNEKADAWWRARQADALDKADAILAMIEAAPSQGFSVSQSQPSSTRDHSLATREAEPSAAEEEREPCWECGLDWCGASCGRWPKGAVDA